MVGTLSEEETKEKVSFKDCKYEDGIFECNGVKKILQENDAFTRKKILQDFVRVTYEKYNNVCNLNVKTCKFSSDNSIFTIYAYCNDRACCSFKMVLNIENEKFNVLRSKEELQHQIGLQKTFQTRGPKRHIVKSELVNKTALIYRKEAINKQSKALRIVGNDQNVRSLSTIRKIRSEAMGHFDYDKHPLIDTFIMSETNYKHFIKHVATPLRVYLLSLKRIEMLYKFDDLLLKESNYTLRIDATGGVVQPLQCTNKRIFLYSIIAHFPSKAKVFPVADAILCNHTSYEIGLFLHFIKETCVTNKLKWPVCNRVITDCSYAIINALLAEFNGMSNIHQYLMKCYNFLINIGKMSLDFVTIQYCTSHYTKIICKDIDEKVPLDNVELRKFLREAIGLAFNFTTLKECREWFQMMCCILSGPYLNSEVSQTINKFLEFTKSNTEENVCSEQSEKIYLEEIETNTLEEISKLSPFTHDIEEISKKSTDFTVDSGRGFAK